MSNSLQILDWDSNFFGYPIAKIIAADIDGAALQQLVDEAKAKGLKLVYLFTNPKDELSNAAVEKVSAKLVDEKVTFHISINDGVVSSTDEHIEDFSKPQPTEKLTSLAFQSGLYSRYKIDPEFKNNEFEKLYLKWIENSVNKQIADHTLVYMEDGVELGFVTVKVKGSYGDIGLIAVDETSRGKSIGKKLVLAVIDILKQKGIHDLEVATQADNEDACNFYRKVGFDIGRTENIYHIWL